MNPEDFVSQTAPVRVSESIPREYRLAVKADGTIVLQGKLYWQEGFVNYGYDWKDMPTVPYVEPQA